MFLDSKPIGWRGDVQISAGCGFSTGLAEMSKFMANKSAVLVDPKRPKRPRRKRKRGKGKSIKKSS